MINKCQGSCFFILITGKKTPVLNSKSPSFEYLKPACYWFKFWIKIQSNLQILDLNLRGIHQGLAICSFISVTLPDAVSLHPPPNKILIKSHQPKQKSIINQCLQNDLVSKKLLPLRGLPMPVGHPSKDFTELQFSQHLLNSLKLPVFVLLGSACLFQRKQSIVR